MNAPAPGWHPDPTSRHEYRYWDGGQWTDDVSDGGVTSVDPVAQAQPGGYPSGDPATTPFSPTDTYGGPGGTPSGAQYPQYGAPAEPGQPVKKGPSPGLLVAIAAVVVLLVGGLVYVLTSDDDDPETATDDIGTETPTTTAGGDESTTTTSGSSGGDLSDDSLVEAMAIGIEDAAGGVITREQAECVAQGMLDQFGAEGLIAMGADSANPLAGMSPEEQSQLMETMLDCVPADVLIQIGENGLGG
jgi:hypothetical protein